MKKCLLLGLCLTLVSIAHAATYYVSYEGRDHHSGKSPDQAWRTLKKVNAMMSSLQPGDQVLFRRGDRFPGQLTITASGSAGSLITFGAYGSGDKPIIDGFQRLTHWEAVGNHIWKAHYSSPRAQAYNLFINHRFQPIGRYPNVDEANGGYLAISGGNGRDQLSSEALTGGPWEGGEAVIRSRRWILDRLPIGHHQGNHISLTHPTNYYAAQGYGFFIVNHRNTLDQEGEWAYHPSEQALYLHSRQDPNTRAVLTAHVSQLIAMQRVHHIAIRHLDLWGAAEATVFIKNSKHITVSDCHFYGSGQNGATVLYSERIAFLRNRFNDTNNNGIMVEQGTHVEVGGNTFTRTGLIAGMGASGNNAYCAVRGKAQHFNVHHNRIDQVGYNGVSFIGDHINIQYNHVTNFCRIKDDGAGIYAGNSAPHPHKLIQIKNNIVGEGYRTTVGLGTANPDLVHVNGIYLDNHTNGAVIENNTVYGCDNYGIYLHNAYNNRLKNNTLYDNWRALGFSHDTRAADAPIRGIVAQNNVLFARKSDQELLHLRSVNEDHFRFGTIDHNYYYSPLKQGRIIRSTDRNYKSRLFNLAQWQKDSPYDQASQAGTERWPRFAISQYLSDNLLPNAAFTSDTRGWQGWSKQGDGAIHHAEGVLDGGSLAMAFVPGGESSWLAVSTNKGVGPLRQGEQLVLRYSLKSTGDAALETKVVAKGGPYRLLSNVNHTAAVKERQEVEEFFTINHSEAQGVISIGLPKNAHKVYIDNASLHKVATQPVDYDQYVQFLVNPSRQRTSFSLPGGQWKSVRGQTFRRSVTIEPFQSIILLRAEGNLSSPHVARHAHTEKKAPLVSEVSQRNELANPALQLYPNPLVEGNLIISIEAVMEQGEVQIYDPAGKLLMRRSVAGQRQVSFSGKELGMGLRLIKVITPERTLTGKVIVQ